ncbi:MAG: hypothetical protein K0Q74_845 [Gammaproteobacteria bacterium]|nr:hypothetical protein [Gammaproteobacteria bacterium]
MFGNARVAELADALDLGSSGATRESSSLSFRTNIEELLSGRNQLGCVFVYMVRA